MEMGVDIYGHEASARIVQIRNNRRDSGCEESYLKIINGT